MKSIGIFFLAAGIVFSPNLLHAQATAPDSIVQATAENQGLSLIAREDLPLTGTFWLITSNGFSLPMPCAPLDQSIPIYVLSDNVFLADGTGGLAALNPHRAGYDTVDGVLDAQASAVENLVSQTEAAQMRPMMRAMGMSMDSQQTDTPDASGFYNDADNYTWDTNQLWLEITNVTPDTTFANLRNGTNQVYAIWSATNIATPLNQWQVATELWPTDTNCQPFMVPNFGGQNLYLRAEDWTGVDSDNDGIPDWWAWKFFGRVNLVATNLDWAGNTLFHDYTNNLVTNIFIFSGIEVANNYVQASPVPVRLNVVGYPYYMAVQVDDTNLNGAAWNLYSSSNLPVNLGSSAGWHQVWVGLRGHADAATNAVWREIGLNLDPGPPVITVTSPAPGTVSVPFIQLLGYVSEPVAALTFDVSNADGIISNQPAYVSGQLYDTNAQAWTTSFFQGYDVALADGLNTITLHAIDLAGNTSTATISYTRNYYANGGGGGGSSNNIVPALSLAWPADGTVVCGTNFTFEGSVDDPTVAISAIIVDANGNTNTVAGKVDRDGTVWVKDLPLNAGASTLTVMAKNAAGNVSTTSVTLNQSSVLVTFTPPTGDLTTVSGTVSDSTARVYVNTIPAAVNSDGTWTASGVPVSATGTAVYDVVVYPAADVPPPPPPPPGGGGGNNNSVVISPLTSGNDLTMTADALPTDKSPVGYEKFTAVPPPVVQVVAYQEDSAWDLYYSLTYWSVTHDVGSRMVSWSEGFDGIKHDSGIRSEYFDTLFQGDFPYDEQTVLPPDWASANACYGMAMLHEATGNRQVDAQTALKTGGEYVPGQMNLYLLKVAAYNSWYNPAIMNEETDYVPVAKVQVPGWTLTPDMADMNWGDFIVSAPAQATVPMTPTAPGVSDYSFGFQVNQVNLQPAVDANRDGSITFDSQDQTSSANYYRFWVNDDQDDAYAGDVVPVTARDCDDFIINSPRDLEDLSRLHLLVQGLTNELAHGTFLLGLKWKNVTGTPSINIFPAAETNGGTLYLTDTNVAIQQAPAVTPCPTVLNNANNYHQVDTSGTFLINSTFWQTAGAIATNSVAHLLFEGCAVGKGQLVVTINKPDGTELAEAGSVWLDIKDIKAMYQRAVTTPSDDSFAPPYNQSGSAYYANSVFDESSLSYSIGTSIAFDKPQDETPQCVVFVHGWNMDDNEYLSFSETMFKRFWWQGYKGRFCAFHWATLTGFTTYNTSEFRAWKYGLSLKKYVESLKANLSGYTMNIVAHSMGNIVTSSALNRGLTVDNYVLLQAAVPAGCYDTSSGINSYGVFATAEASKTTPDLAVPDMGYRGYLANVSGNLVNFYNANDFALATGNLATFTHIPFLWWIDANWEANEVESKPDYFTSQVYNYDSTQTLLQRGQLLIRHAGPTYTVDHYVTDPQESMSFVARPRSKAVGALADVGGTITSQVDLNANFGFDRNRDEHSAEFNWNIQRVGGFYSELLSDLLPQHP